MRACGDIGSIPTGTIKRIGKEEFTSLTKSFQYLLVRLKD